MQELIQFLISNPKVFWLLVKVLFGYWTFSALVGALEAPDSKTPAWRAYAFRVLHIFAGNVNRAAMKFSVPGAKEDQQ